MGAGVAGGDGANSAKRSPGNRPSSLGGRCLQPTSETRKLGLGEQKSKAQAWVTSGPARTAALSPELLEGPLSCTCYAPAPAQRSPPGTRVEERGPTLASDALLGSPGESVGAEVTTLPDTLNRERQAPTCPQSKSSSAISRLCVPGQLHTLSGPGFHS